MSFVDINPDAFEEYAKDVSNKAKARTVYEKMGGVMQVLSGEVLAEAKDRTHVRTGQLRGAWQTTPMQYSSQKFSFVIYNNTAYAPFVEYGHRTRNHKGWVNGQNMLKDTIRDYRNYFESYWEPKFTYALRDVIDK